MKVSLFILTCTLSAFSGLVPFSSALAFSVNTAQDSVSAEHNAWLKEQYSVKHQQLIPVVAVADMFSACNRARKVDPIHYRLADLVTKMDRNQLATKLSLCLGDDSMQSDAALNFGLIGCFSDQLSQLSNEERLQKMKLVEKAILSLSRDERKKSFTQCVTQQAIQYLP